MLPETHYAHGEQGRLAYQIVGDGPINIVPLLSAGSIDLMWDIPPFARWFERLAKFSRLILFDRRGHGGSDPMPSGAMPTWEEWAEDITLVMDSVGSKRAAVLSTLDEGPIAMLFAAAHPDRTTSLMLANTTARIVVADDYPAGLPLEVALGLIETTEAIWGTEDMAAAVASSIAGDPLLRGQFAKYLRGWSARSYGTQMRHVLEFDVRDVLASIHVPTLVAHSRDLQFIPIEQGRYLAANIPGAKYVEVASADGVLQVADGDFYLELIEEFLTGVRRGPEADRVLATVLFTDIVGSTQRAASMGDRSWRDLLAQHHRVVRHELAAFKGKEVDTAGDGFMARFDGPARAIRCAQAILQRTQELGLDLRAGIHTGECEILDKKLSGIAVHPT